MVYKCYTLFNVFFFFFARLRSAALKKKGVGLFCFVFLFFLRVNPTQLTQLWRELHLCIQSCHFAWWCVHNVLHVFVANMRLRHGEIQSGEGGQRSRGPMCSILNQIYWPDTEHNSCVFSFRQTYWKSLWWFLRWEVDFSESPCTFKPRTLT